MILQPYNSLDALPSSLRIYGASDYATMEPEVGKKEPDFTEHGVWGIDAIGDLWAIDWFYKQCETDKGVDEFLKLVKRYKPLKWAHEGGLIDKAIKPMIRQQMRLQNAFVSMEALTKLEDKSVKLAGFHARVTAGTVHFPIRRPWAEHVIDQLIKFPGGRWDDAADVCGLIGRLVDKMFEAPIPVVQKRQILVPFSAEWVEWNDRPQAEKVRYFT